MKLSRRLFLLSPLALACKPSWGALKFPLPQGHFVPAKMPMHPVFPRPDNETQSHARHRWAHPDFRYEIPIGVQGGAWPFKYEIISAPSGATVGQHYGDPDYGVVKWTPANGDTGTKTFTVRVTDQELNTVDLTWTTTIDPTQFIFVDANTVTSGTGTILSPLKTFADWYRGDYTDATYHNKIIVFRGGSYAATGDPNRGGNVRMESTAKTPSVIGFPDETPVIDWSGAKWFFAGGFQDLFIANLRFNNARTDVANSHFMWITGNENRITIWNNYFHNLGNGAQGTDNPSGIFISETGLPVKNNLLIKGNTFDSFTNNGSNGSFCDIYLAEYVLIEENICKNSNTSYGIWPKATHHHVTVRANDLTQNNTRSPIVIGLWSPRNVVQHDYEVCWNNSRVSSGHAVRISQEKALSSYNIYCYRNTFVGDVAFRFTPNEPYHVDANVAEIARPNQFTQPSIGTAIPNIVEQLGSGIVDTLGRLTGPYRQKYLGIIGHEITDSTLTKIPKKPTSILVQ